MSSAKTGTAGRKELHVVTGGGGCPGFTLGKHLAAHGHRVKLLDIRPPVWTIPDGVEYVELDIRKTADVVTALDGADVVYHMASFGMSGRDQLNEKVIEAVNILGTRNVLEGCLVNGLTRLVYTSTYNTIFGGQEIVNGDESLPYLEEDKFTDNYSKTKQYAERLVLAADKTATHEGSILRTCALRLAGVYGPGEQRHIPRIVSYVEAGLVKVTYGSLDSKVDFLHVENLALAHRLAGEALTAKKNYIAGGQAYFISDGKPVNNFEFFRPLIEGLGYTYPSVVLPLWLVFWFAYLTEMVHKLVGGIYNFQPLLTRTEVYKTGVTHYFSIGKAERELGYKPVIQNDLSEVVRHYQRTGHGKQKSSGASNFFLNMFLAAIFVCLIMWFLPMVK